MKVLTIARTSHAARQSFQLNQPFAQLHWPDLMSPAELKFWASSPLGSAFLASIFRGQGFESGPVQSRSAATTAQHETNFGMTATRYSIEGGEPMAHAPKLKPFKSSGVLALCSTTGRGEIRRGAVVSGGSFDVPLFESRADAQRGLQPDDVLRQFVHAIASQAANRAVRKVEDKIGHQFSDTAREEALAEALSAVVSGLHRLCRDWIRVARFIRPAFSDRTLLSERRRRTWLWLLAYRAAFRSMTANQAGLTGRKSSVQVVELEHADSIPMPDAESIEERGRADYRKARRLMWTKLQCAWGLPRKAGRTFNIAESGRAVRSRWRLLMLLLRGTPSTEAVRRCGFGESFLRSGRLSRLLATVGVQNTAGFVN
jgi:hypothetical protein